MDRILRLIDKLEIASTQFQLPGTPVDPEESLDESELNKLISYASILSLSDSPDKKNLSYEIITRLLELRKKTDHKLIRCAEIILSRLGNFPGRQLLRERFETNNDELPSFLKLECLSREIENSVFINDEKSIHLTDFQYKFFSSLQEEKALSISAPTSAGKSFVLGLNLIKKIREKKFICVIYIVPTRALISEVSIRIRNSLKEYKLDNVTIRTAPFQPPQARTKNSIIYVFTQERLISYLNSVSEEIPPITSVVIDEAHEIQKGKRGILLQSAIDYLLKRYPETEILFASPLISNPGYFFSIFNISRNGKFFTETISPVSQNTLLVSEVHRKPKQIAIDLLSRNKKLSAGIRNIDFQFRGKASLQKAHLARSISKNSESVIIFSNGPANAESVAQELTKIISEYSIGDSVKSFIDFLKKEIHPEYLLIPCLKKGVGFHYGKMPSIVRSGVENLFKNGLITYICCTSTLLQGVNLPAKHIIIENPKSGDEPMTRSDFQNLSGRAGRLLKEFHGNIWCIRPSTWEEESYQGDKLQEISSAISSVMVDGGSLIQDLIENSIKEKNTIDEAEMALSKLYQDFHYSGRKDPLEIYRTEGNSQQLDSTISLISEIQITLPVDIIEKNKSIRPDHLQKVYDFLYNQKTLDDLLPLNPFKKGAKKIMENIIDVFIKCFDWKLSQPYKNSISYLAYNWMWGKTLGELIGKQVNFKKETHPRVNVTQIIRSYLRMLEEDVRFKLVKYFSAYNDILKYVLDKREEYSDDHELEPYHIYLEFGSCDSHALNIMATGLSRFTALYLAAEIKNEVPSTIDDYYEKIKSINLNQVNIPKLCKQEVLRMLGKAI